MSENMKKGVKKGLRREPQFTLSLLLATVICMIQIRKWFNLGTCSPPMPSKVNRLSTETKKIEF
jgi:hypothetical protein